MAGSKAQIGWKKLGELLIEDMIITKEQLERALRISRRNSRKVGETLIDMGLITPKQLAVTLALQCRRFIDTLV
ncbi:hypothetical protein ACFLVP_00240 [Chloroflexota bacterium]